MKTKQVTLTCINPRCTNYHVALSRTADVEEHKEYVQWKVTCSGCNKEYTWSYTKKRIKMG